MQLQIAGRIESVGDTVSIPSKNGGGVFYRRKLILDCTRYDPETGEPRANFPEFEFAGKNCSRLDPFSVGDKVIVSFVLSGVKYADKNTSETKYFTRVVGYDIKHATGSQARPPQDVNTSAAVDDLPF